MSQEKDDKSKSSGKPEVGTPADTGKRPYATIEGKAVEIQTTATAAKAGIDRAGAAASAPVTGAATSAAPGGAAKPEAAPASVSGSAAATSSAQASTSAKPAVSATATTGSAKPAASMGAIPGKPAAPAASAAALWLPSLISGAAGAILALFGLGSLGLIGGDPQAGATAERIAVLEKALAARPGAAAQVAAVEARLAAMETAAKDLAVQHTSVADAAKALETRVSNQAPVASAAADRVQKLEQQLADIAAAAANDPQRGRIPALAQITTKLGDLDTQLTTRSQTLKSEINQELEKRLAASAETAETARARLAQRTQTIEQTLKSVADDTTALRSTVEGLKGDLEQRFKAAAKPADVAAALEPVAAKVTGLEKNLATVVRSEQDRNATAGNILLSIELGNLKRALDRGGKYASELAAVKKVGGDKLKLDILEQAQNSGVPSLATLTTEFRSLAYMMLDAEAEPVEGSVLDRMLASAKSVVRVRKVVHGADDKGTDAVIGRMEAFLKDGHLGEVLEESRKLPEKPLKTATAWLDKIKARFTIETALADLEQSLKNSLAGSADIKKGAN